MDVFKPDNRRSLMIWAFALVLTLGSAAALVRAIGAEGDPRPAGKPTLVTVKWVISGHKVRIKPDDQLVYAGIRTPYSDEPMHDEARFRNEELVRGKELRLRFDKQTRDRKGRLLAYAFVDNTFVNETLVREGLAYVRLTKKTLRFAEKLLAAQREAREERRGLWRHVSDDASQRYAADPKYGTFHLPNCDVAARIKLKRRVILEGKAAAFAGGYAPCNKCRP
ncbi:MAG: thermonuclease family protein [Phycisphaerae bacterium]